MARLNAGHDAALERPHGPPKRRLFHYLVAAQQRIRRRRPRPGNLCRVYHHAHARPAEVLHLAFMPSQRPSARPLRCTNATRRCPWTPEREEKTAILDTVPDGAAVSERTDQRRGTAPRSAPRSSLSLEELRTPLILSEYESCPTLKIGATLDCSPKAVENPPLPSPEPPPKAPDGILQRGYRVSM